MRLFICLILISIVLPLATAQEFQTANKASGSKQTRYQIGKRNVFVRLFVSNEEKAKELLPGVYQTPLSSDITALDRVLYVKAWTDMTFRAFLEQHPSYMLSSIRLSELPTSVSLLDSPSKGEGRFFYFSQFGRYTLPPSEIGLSGFGEGSDRIGMTINPQLMTCGLDLLKLIKITGDSHSSEFNQFNISGINIFLKPVSVVDQKDYKLEINPAHAVKESNDLNVQIPIVMPQSDCKLPEQDRLNAAFEATVCQKSTAFDYCKTR